MLPGLVPWRETFFFFFLGGGEGGINEHAAEVLGCCGHHGGPHPVGQQVAGLPADTRKIGTGCDPELMSNLLPGLLPNFFFVNLWGGAGYGQNQDP